MKYRRIDMNKFNQVVYQMFIRDFTKEGTFKAAEERLGYVKDLGVTVIQLMPFHPIGVVGRKGTYGSPYAIQDYEKVSPDYGTLEDLKSFVSKAHSLGIRVVMDVVYNHTSRDSKLLDEHPGWFYRNKEGMLGNKIGDWADVYDLDHSKPELEDYLVSVIETYVKEYGIDGFRFDVCSLIPLSFYRLLRSRLDSINPDLIYIGEAVETRFVMDTWKMGYVGATQQELMDAGFDILYPYDILDQLFGYLEKRGKDEKLASRYLAQYKALFNLAEMSISKDKAHLCTIENHDQPRIASYSDDDVATRSLLAYSFFIKGMGFMMFGEELKIGGRLDFFEKETMDPTIYDQSYFDFVKKNIALKKREINDENQVTEMLDGDEGLLALMNFYPQGRYEIGLFPIDGVKRSYKLPVGIEGNYRDLLSGETVECQDGIVEISKPLILARD